MPLQKVSGDLSDLQRVQIANVEPGKFYYIRVRNKDKSEDVYGYKMDFVGEINKTDSAGVSFFVSYKRSGDPRDGTPRWEKDDNNMVFIPMEAITKRNMDDNTTFYIKENQKVKKTRRNKGKILQKFRNLFGFTRTKK